MDKIRIHRGWRVATVIIGVIAIVGLTVLGVFLRNTGNQVTSLDNDLENVYQRAYYELIGNVNVIEINLSKIKVTKSDSTKIELLNEVSKNAHLAGSALSTLSAQNLQVLYTTRYVNQTGDFTTYLMKELVNGRSMTKDDKEILDSLYNMTREIGERLAVINDEIANGKFKFTKVLAEDEGLIMEVFEGLEESIVEYPSLIYDGPFSTALLEKKALSLPEEEITSEEGINRIDTMFSEFGIKDVKFIEESESYFSMYTYEAKNESDETMNIQISKNGGVLSMANVSKNVSEPSLSPEECAELAEQYADDLGYENMKSVWVSNYNSIIYVNLASEHNGIILYPDLVKMKIASNNGDLIGVEALSYVFNHHDRTISTPTLSETQAVNYVSTDISIESIRLALIPSVGGEEILTYEISGTCDEAMYFVYVDARTGEEVNIMRVIESDEGSLIM